MPPRKKAAAKKPAVSEVMFAFVDFLSQAQGKESEFLTLSFTLSCLCSCSMMFMSKPRLLWKEIPKKKKKMNLCFNIVLMD